VLFRSPQGKVAGPVKLPLGWAIFETTSIETIPTKSMDAAKPEIVSALGDRKRKTLLSELIAKIEDGIANGGTFDEAVRNNGLQVVTTPAIVANGDNVSDRNYRPAAEVQPLLKPAFDMEADDDAQMVMIAPDERYALLDVTDIIAAAPPPLAELKSLVAQQYMLHEGAAKARTVAEKIRSEVAKGKTLEQAMADTGTALPPVQKVAGRRADLLRTDKRPPAEISIMFAMMKGSIKAVPIPQEQGTFLVILDDIQQGDAAKVPGLVDRVRNDVGRVVQREYSDQLEKAMERDLGVERKASVISRVMQELQRANGGAAK
jgi:peptidyl-prolyl cis-trans isomerase D